MSTLSCRDPTIAHDRASESSLLASRLATASSMDVNQQSRYESGRTNLDHQRSSSSLQQSSSGVRPASYTSPLPQAQWEDVPEPYRPRDWQQPIEGPPPPIVFVPEPLFSWRLRPSAEEIRQPAAATRRRRRPGAIRSNFWGNEIEEHARGADPSFLYPQMSPYDDNNSSLSAPDELEYFPRSVSQPNTPSYLQQSQPLQHLSEPPLLMIPRSPTYPPASRRRIRSATSIAEATFTDEEEFHLFVQATAGLGPEQAYRHSNSSSDFSNNNSFRNAKAAAQQTPDTDHLVSPIQETPTTMFALQQLAQLPQGTDPAPGQRYGSARPPPTQRLDTSTSDVDFWLHPPSATYDENNVSPIDDELPDYASSQAQAQAVQRVEAARRAQELQRRWQQRQ